MLVEVEGGKLKTVSGDKDNPDSQGFLCVRRRSTNEIFGNARRAIPRVQLEDPCLHLALRAGETRVGIQLEMRDWTPIHALVTPRANMGNLRRGAIGRRTDCPVIGKRSANLGWKMVSAVSAITRSRMVGEA
jgi:hypothetical protein